VLLITPSLFHNDMFFFTLLLLMLFWSLHIWKLYLTMYLTKRPPFHVKSEYNYINGKTWIFFLNSRLFLWPFCEFIVFLTIQINLVCLYLFIFVGLFLNPLFSFAIRINLVCFCPLLLLWSICELISFKIYIWWQSFVKIH